MSDLEILSRMLSRANVVGIPSDETLRRNMPGETVLNISDGKNVIRFVFHDGEFKGVERQD